MAKHKDKRMIEAMRYLATVVYPNGNFIKEWITSPLKIEENDWVYIDSLKGQVHIIKIWKSEPTTMLL